MTARFVGAACENQHMNARPEMLNPDSLRNEIRIAITNQLGPALKALPGRWPLGRRRFLFFSHRKRVAESLTHAVWPLIVDAVLGMAQSVIDEHENATGRRDGPDGTAD